MAVYSKDRLRLVSQGIVGGKVWYYDDTGLNTAVGDVAGFFSNAGDMGVDTGDLLIIQARGGGAGTANAQIHTAAFTATQDTGATQGATGPVTLIGDTG